MRRTAVVAIATLLLSGLGLVTVPRADAAPNCTPDAVTGVANQLFGGPAPVATPPSCVVPVHPGALISVDGSHGGGGGSCTANFVFRGTDARLYLGTAGHCTLAESNLSGDVGEFADPAGKGAEVRDKNGRRIGEVAYAVQQEPKDFALIRLDRGIRTGRFLPHWGPVTGINTSTDSGPTVLRWVGHGLAIGDLLYARSGVALGTPDPDQVTSFGLIAPGDSGGPVVDDQGKAVGVNVAIGVSVGTDPGVQIITRLAPQLQRASAVTGVGYTLA